ncbi:MAG TPA: MFS transporter, partial [Dehalococcoidia bacterium]|nr:MFS transporter [Dehalococcoidia bacterium]
GVLLAEALALNFVSWLPLLVATSAFIGAAVASFQTGATTLVADLAPVHRRGQAMGIFGTFTTTAVALSPAVATFVMRGIGFTALFAMSAVLAVSGLLLSLTVREPPRRAGTYTKGALLHPAGFLPGLCIFGVTVTYGALISFLPGQAPQMGLENAGLFFTVFAFSTILVRAVAGSVSDRVGRAPVILPALFLVAAAMVLLGQSTGPAMILAVGFMYGLGYGSAHPTVMALAVDRGGPDARASAVATFNVSYNLGLAAGSLAMGFLLAATSFALMAAVAGAIPFLALATLYVRRGPVTKPP